jgi:NaMN:DMB phosphoribosyltransferase
MDTVVWAEARVYSVVQDKVLWVGESVSTNTTTVAAFVKELSAQAADGVKKAGLLGK